MMLAGNIFLQRFTVGGYPINGYLIADPATRIGAFVDPGGHLEEIDRVIAAEKIDLRFLLFTHGHWDHTDGLGDFQKRYSVKCCAGPGEVNAASVVLHHGDTIELGRQRITVLSAPGHTPHQVTFLCGDSLFSGDALFCGSLGGTSNADDAQRQVEAVREHLFALPDQTRVFPAHGPITTIGAEKYANPFFV